MSSVRSDGAGLREAFVFDLQAGAGVGRLTMAAVVSRRWDTFALSPNPAAVAELLDTSPLQRLIVDGSGQEVALFQLHELDLLSLHANLAVVARGDLLVAGSPLAGFAARFVRECFDTYPLRMLYLELARDQAGPVVTHLLPGADLCGALDDHVRRGADRYEAMEIYRISPLGHPGP
jgi:hypothetical protein